MQLRSMARLSMSLLVSTVAVAALLSTGVRAETPAPTVKALKVEKPQRLLFVGNSYLYYGDSLHNHVRRMVIAAGIHPKKKLKYKSATISGSAIFDHNIEPGKLRVKTGGGVAGHNGLRSIAENLGTRDFRRVRVGIGHPGHKALVTGHVLGNFAADDRQWLEPLLDAMVTATPLLASGDDAGFMNKVALLVRPPKHDPESEHKTKPARAEPDRSG